MTAGVIMLLFGLAAQSGHGAERQGARLVARTLEPDQPSAPEPLRLPDSELEPIEWKALDGWAADDHGAAFATFLASCRPLIRTIPPEGETRPIYFALKHVCRRALAAGRLAQEQARLFFERNFRPLRIAKLGHNAGFLTGYYPVIQIQGSARVRLEDGTMLRINYDAHNGYPFVPVSRVLIARNIIPRDEMSPERIREWMRANPQSAGEVRRQNRSFVFFRIVGLSDGSDDREAVGAQGVPLTPGRSIAVDKSLHVYGTPFFIRAGLPLTAEKRTASFDRLMISQDTGSAIVGPARADIYWGAGDRAGEVAGRLRHPGSFATLVPREIDPVVAGARMPLPPERPPAAEAGVKTRLPKSPRSVHPRQFGQAIAIGRDLRSQSRQRSGCFGTSALSRKPVFGRTEPERGGRAAGADCAPSTFPPRRHPRSHY